MRPAVCVAAGGFAAEVALLASAPDNVFACGGGLFTVVFLAWFWMTAAALGVVVLNAIRRIGATPAGRLGVLLVSLVYLVAAGLYGLSWGLYWRSSRFANFESAKFALANARMVWLYLVQTEQRSLWLFGIPIAATLIALPTLVLRFAGRGSPPTVACCGSRFRAAWCGGLIAVLVAHQLNDMIARDSAAKSVWPEAWQGAVNPVLTLATSGLASLFVEPIEPCLDEFTLVPIAGFRWNPPPLARSERPSILFVAVESLRADVVGLVHQGQEVMPNLNRLARGCRVFTRAYAPSTHSDYSDVCIVSSLYPLRRREHHYYRATDPWPKTLIYDLLKPNGYATAIVSSQNEGWGRMDQFLETPNLDFFFDAARSGAATRTASSDSGFAEALRTGELRAGKLDDSQTTDAAVEWIHAQTAGGTPFFLQVNYQNSHFPYELAPDTPRPFQPCTIDFEVSFLRYPREKTDVIRNAYYNSLADTDRSLGRLIECLRDRGILDRMIVVIMGENGEAFHENGAVTHAGQPVEPVLRVACVMHAPGRVDAGNDDYPLSLVDVVPTVLGRLGWPKHPNFQGIDVLAPGRPPLERRAIYVHAENPLAQSDAVLLASRWKLIHNRRTCVLRLYDLERDPGETSDMLTAQPERAAQLQTLLSTWRRRQFAYYYFPHYYERFFPPSAP
jgi:arylsulfatase A-like enzyme